MVMRCSKSRYGSLSKLLTMITCPIDGNGAAGSFAACARAGCVCGCKARTG